MTFDHARWQALLDELRATHHVPGASLAVLADGEIHELASGVLHRGTGVEVTTDSVFLAGSLAKPYTATLVMQLVDSGDLELDTPVVDVLPEFATPDPEATKTITIRQLLSHTGGVTNDFNHDTGRGDDCIAKYVQAAREVPLDLPPGTAYSYGSLGYVVLGRVIEVLTGKTWDQALRDMLFAPLGLEHSMTLPEEALRFRVAMGHMGRPGQDPDPTPVWDLMPRSVSPAARVIVSAGDIVRFAKMHLDGGLAPDGTRILSTAAVAAMQRREVDCPDKWTVEAEAWGLGWNLHDWNGVFGFGHVGSAVAQHSYLRVAPHAGVAFALLANGGGFTPMYDTLFRELWAELTGTQVPPLFAPPENPPEVDLTPLLGTYEREGVRTTITRNDDGRAHIRYEFTGSMAHLSPPLEADMVPVSDTVFAAVFGIGGEDYTPVVFSTLSNGTPCVYVSMRATPKIA
ncbi:serine hydrolase domain-containing protein [Saccharopolyspora sp. 5N708]|uniref:serine hydrolase domain-containing protein n=1 Tax=Saccharopolyspora sp. 5N708 TaxID=3457424 RepID=UPI003FD39355